MKALIIYMLVLVMGTGLFSASRKQVAAAGSLNQTCASIKQEQKSVLFKKNHAESLTEHHQLFMN